MASRNHFSTKDIILIKDFINEIDEDINIYRSNRFSVDIDEEEIYLGNKRYDRVSKIFMNWLNKHFRTDINNWLAISLLHEVGHIMTNTDDMRDTREKLDSIYSFLYENGIIETEEEYFIKYFEIEAELEATSWAVDYYLSHREECDCLSLELGCGVI